jgi:hypothetical protein
MGTKLPFAKERTSFVLEAVGGGASLANILGVSRSQPTQWKKGAESPGPEASRALLDLDYVVARASLLWEPQVVQDWLVGSNAFLHGARPVDVLRKQGAPPVIEAIDAEMAGVYA